MSIRSVNSFAGTTPTNTVQKAQPKFQGQFVAIQVPQDIFTAIKTNATGELVPGLGVITREDKTIEESELTGLFPESAKVNNTITEADLRQLSPQLSDKHTAYSPFNTHYSPSMSSHYEWKPENTDGLGSMKLTIRDGWITECSANNRFGNPETLDLTQQQIAKQVTEIMQANYKNYSSKA